MGDKKHKCYYCFQEFGSKFNMVRHINSKHIGIREYMCSYCSKTFSTKQNQQIHEHIHRRKKSPVIYSTRVTHRKEFLLSDHYREPEVRLAIPEDGPKPEPLPCISETERQKQRNPRLPLLMSLI